MKRDSSGKTSSDIIFLSYSRGVEEMILLNSLRKMGISNVILTEDRIKNPIYLMRKRSFQISSLFIERESGGMTLPNFREEWMNGEMILLNSPKKSGKRGENIIE